MSHRTRHDYRELKLATHTRDCVYVNEQLFYMYSKQTYEKKGRATAAVVPDWEEVAAVVVADDTSGSNVDVTLVLKLVAYLLNERGRGSALVFCINDMDSGW